MNEEHYLMDAAKGAEHFGSPQQALPAPGVCQPGGDPQGTGLMAYRMMIGLIKLSGSLPPEAYAQVLYETVNNALKVMFILMSLAGGVAIPMLLSRKESAKHLRFRLPEDDNEVG